MGYYQANCIVFLPKQGGRTPLTTPLGSGPAYHIMLQWAMTAIRRDLFAGKWQKCPLVPPDWENLTRGHDKTITGACKDSCERILRHATYRDFSRNVYKPNTCQAQSMKRFGKQFTNIHKATHEPTLMSSSKFAWIAENQITLQHVL